jgi:hypothetical protein
VAQAGGKIGYEGARHLLNRAGFGASDSEVRAFAALTRDEAADRLLAEARREATLAPPAFVNDPFSRTTSSAAERRRADGGRARAAPAGRRDARLVAARDARDAQPAHRAHDALLARPLRHQQQKVRSGQLMYRQNVLLRREALGNFGDAAARDRARSRDAGLPRQRRQPQRRRRTRTSRAR